MKISASAYIKISLDRQQLIEKDVKKNELEFLKNATEMAEAYCVTLTPESFKIFGSWLKSRIDDAPSNATLQLRCLKNSSRIQLLQYLTDEYGTRLMDAFEPIDERGKNE